MGKETMHIRAAREDDAAGLADVIRRTGWFKHIEAEVEETTQARVRQHLALCEADESHSVYVALGEHEQLLGYASVHWLPYLFLPAPEGYLSELFVDPLHRGRGTGQALLEAVQQEAQQRGCSRLMLITGRNRESYRREFYARQGWHEREEMANFIRPLQAYE